MSRIKIEAGKMNNYFSTKKLCFVALFTALSVATSSFGIPVPGGHLYLTDAVICLAALIFDPVSAFIVGGVGAFLGDLFFYPTPMFVSLVTHGVQAVAISLIVGRKEDMPKLWRAIVAVAVGGIIMVTGYSIGKAFIYSTPEYAIIKLPYEIAQAVLGAVVALLLLYRTPLKKAITVIPKK